MYVYRENLAVPCDSCRKEARVKIVFPRTCYGYDMMTYLCSDCAKELKEKLQDVKRKEEK